MGGQTLSIIRDGMQDSPKIHIHNVINYSQVMDGRGREGVAMRSMSLFFRAQIVERTFLLRQRLESESEILSRAEKDRLIGES